MLKQIFSENFLQSETLTDPAQFDFDEYNKSPSRSNPKKMDIFDVVKVRKGAERWNTKNYPQTAQENKLILKNYIELCLYHKVTPLITIFPCTKLWQIFYSKQKFDELYYLIDELKSKYPIHFLDGLKINSLNEFEDFSDGEHLNDNGARKFSKAINQFIMNLEYK